MIYFSIFHAFVVQTEGKPFSTFHFLLIPLRSIIVSRNLFVHDFEVPNLNSVLLSNRRRVDQKVIDSFYFNINQRFIRKSQRRSRFDITLPWKGPQENRARGYNYLSLVVVLILLLVQTNIFSRLCNRLSSKAFNDRQQIKVLHL